MAIDIKKGKGSDDEVVDAVFDDDDDLGGSSSGADVFDPLDRPDLFLQTADKSVTWIERNGVLVVGGVVALVLALIVGFVVVNQQQAGADERSVLLSAAVKTMTGVVQADPAKVDAKSTAPVYSTPKAKYEAMLAEADKVLSAHPSEEVAAPAKLIKARALLGLGKGAEAATLYQEWLTANANSPERPFVLQALATAQATAGKTADAIGTLDTLKGIDAKRYGEQAAYRKATIYEAAGDKAKAKAAFEDFVKNFPESEQVEMAKMRKELL